MLHGKGVPKAEKILFVTIWGTERVQVDTVGVLKDRPNKVFESV
jgi:hypothetical protein